MDFSINDTQNYNCIDIFHNSSFSFGELSLFLHDHDFCLGFFFFLCSAEVSIFASFTN